MPLDRFVLILLIVIAAAGVTVWLGAIAVAAVELPWLGLGLLIPLGLIAHLLLRVIGDRLDSREDDHYDRLGR